LLRLDGQKGQSGNSGKQRDSLQHLILPSRSLLR
jgi:hypothetical protein